MSKQAVINYLATMNEFVPKDELFLTLYKTNLNFLQTKVVTERVDRPDKIQVAGTRFDLPLDLLGTAEYDIILANLIENEFESPEDFKLVNNTAKLIDWGYKLVNHDDEWIVIRLSYEWVALNQFFRFLYYVNKGEQDNELADKEFYRMVIQADNYLPELRNIFELTEIPARIQFFKVAKGTVKINFLEDRDKYLEPMIRLNLLRAVY
jgi:hypothetical protein